MSVQVLKTNECTEIPVSAIAPTYITVTMYSDVKVSVNIWWRSMVSLVTNASTSPVLSFPLKESTPKQNENRDVNEDPVPVVKWYPFSFLPIFAYVWTRRTHRCHS